jgi:hypothetical protein
METSRENRSGTRRAVCRVDGSTVRSDAAIAGSFCGDDETRSLAGVCSAAFQASLAGGARGPCERWRHSAGFFARKYRPQIELPIVFLARRKARGARIWQLHVTSLSAGGSRSQ